MVDSSLFVCHSTAGTLFLLLYIDDIIVTGDSPYLDWFIHQLSREFDMKDIGPLHNFLGIEVAYFDGGISLPIQVCKGSSYLWSNEGM